LPGIPQGSVLGPLLLVIYINELPSLVKSCIYLFADDTKIFRPINSEADSKLLQADLDILIDWSKKWLLTFHPNKCKSMTIGKQPASRGTIYKLNYPNTVYELEKVDNEKDLGVIIDSDLNFDKHINEKVNKANSMFGMIRRSFDFLSESNFTYLYKALVRSHLDYASSVWSPYKIKHIEAIESVQRRATKQLPNLSKLSYEDRLKKLHLPTLAFRRIREVMIECFKIIRGIYDKDVTNFMTPRLDVAERTSPRAHCYQLYLAPVKKLSRKNFFSIRVMNKWNSLPREVVEAPSINAFKNRLDRHWSNQELVYNYRAGFNISRHAGGRTYPELDIVVADCGQRQIHP
jgi:hypothetical protein